MTEMCSFKKFDILRYFFNDRHMARARRHDDWQTQFLVKSIESDLETISGIENNFLKVNWLDYSFVLVDDHNPTTFYAI